MAKRLSDDELLAITGNEIRQSSGYRTGKLSQARQKNLQYYLGRAVGDLAPPEIDGRSSVVDSSVHDTVEWMLPSLIKTFTGGDSVVEFAPQQQDDEQAAKQATDYVNYVFYRQNPGFQLLNTWFKDALLSKVGILKVMWDETVVEAREEYNSMSAEDLAILQDDEEVEIIESTAKPDEEDAEQRQKAIEQLTQQLQQAQSAPPVQGPQGLMMNPQAMQAIQGMQEQIASIQAQPAKMLYDIACKRTKNTKQVKIFNVPPEEFLINRDAKSIAESRFVAHQVLRTLSDLKAMGYKDVDELTSDDIQASLSIERIERITFNDETGWQAGANEVPGDPSQKQIWVTECYMKVDADGDGISEWRKITRAGNKLLDNEECDGPPFVSITPIPLPHQFFGLCPADQALEIQKQKTVVLRAIHDNLSLSVNGRYFAVDGQVNLDDLLTSRPGGVVRMKQVGMAGRLDQGVLDNGAYQFLDYIELQKESRTGLMRNTQGVNPDAMNQTATGINIMTNRADSRIELIARQFAETGVKDLFKLILKLIAQHQDKAAQIRVSGKWVSIDPRAWRNQYDMTINVGLGTGNRDQEINHLMALIQSQMMSMPVGIVSPKNIFESHNKLSQALGYKQENLFFSDPTDPETRAKMPPPPPNPEMIKAQAQQQIEQAKMQATGQLEQMKAQATLQIEREKMQMQAQVDQHRQEVEAQQQAAKMEKEAELAKFNSELEKAHENAKLNHAMEMEKMRAESARELAKLASATQIKIASMKPGGETAPVVDDVADAYVNDQLIHTHEQIKSEVTRMAGEQVNSEIIGAIQHLSESVQTIQNTPPDNSELVASISKLAEMQGGLMQGMAGVMSQLSKPKTVLRGPDGRVTGVQ